LVRELLHPSEAVEKHHFRCLEIAVWANLLQQT
jgi:hypothetical protein